MTYTNHYISLNPYRGTIVIEWEKENEVLKPIASIPIKEQLLFKI